MHTHRFTLKQPYIGIAFSLLLLISLVALQACRPAASADTDNPAPLPPQTATPPSAPYVAAASPIEAGRYLITLGGCNDCHTPGYMELGGGVPEADWLTGTPVGFRGPWGTTYPANLRLRAQEMTEDQWVTMLHTRTALPPMPWMNVNKLSDQDAHLPVCSRAGAEGRAGTRTRCSWRGAADAVYSVRALATARVMGEGRENERGTARSPFLPLSFFQRVGQSVDVGV